MNDGEQEIVNKEERIAELRKLMSENDQLKQLKSDDAYLERFLNAADFDVEKAFDRMTSFYVVLAEYPEWYTKLTPADKKNIIDKNIRILTEKKDKEGRPIYIVKLGNMDPSTMELVDDVIAVDDFFVETLFLQEYSGIENGLCVIIDISNFSLRITKWLTPNNIKICLKRILSMPIKEFRYHVINSSLMINVAIKIVWPFLPQQIKDSVKFHFSDFQALYEYVDKDVLPEEYGGKLKFDEANQHSLILNKNEEIFENFKTHRFMYLDNVISVNGQESDK